MKTKTLIYQGHKRKQDPIESQAEQKIRMDAYKGVLLTASKTILMPGGFSLDRLEYLYKSWKRLLNEAGTIYGRTKIINENTSEEIQL